MLLIAQHVNASVQEDPFNVSKLEREMVVGDRG